MTDTRLKRRMLGMLDKRLREARLNEVEDPRDRRGRRWKLSALLSTTILGLVAGCKGLLEVESLTEDLSLPTRQRFGIDRRVPDTTLHNLLSTLEPRQVVPILHRVARAAHRRRALGPEGLPFGVLSLDGKSTSLPLRRLSAAQWLLLVRRHWGVETAHQILDMAFDEDDRPWIVACPRAMLVVRAPAPDRLHAAGTLPLGDPAVGREPYDAVAQAHRARQERARCCHC